MNPKSHASPRILITAGPTREPIDAVRYISNRSSGRMGLALASAATTRGWPTTLLAGPGLPKPPDTPPLTVHRFETTADLGVLLTDTWTQHDVLIMAAAVADYRPVQENPGEKLRRGANMTLALEPTEDLLASLVEITHPGQIRIGFALEPRAELEASAREKLHRKGVDAIVANPLETMDAPDVDGRVLLADGSWLTPPGRMPKADFARWLLDQLPVIDPQK